jgi:hypothetical protein
MIAAKLALGFASTLAVAGAYTFREGVIRVDVDEYRQGGSHIHLWVPAAAAPMAVRFVPQKQLSLKSDEMREALPIVAAAVKELERYPNTRFVEVQDGGQHVLVSTEHGKLKVDVTGSDEDVHVAVPVTAIEDVLEQLKARTHDSGSPI